MHRTFLIHWQNYRYLADRAIVIFQTLQRRAELEELTKWAQRKRLKHLRKLYQMRMQDEEQRVASYGIKHPSLFGFCEWWNTIALQIKGTQPFYSKGAAVKHRLV